MGAELAQMARGLERSGADFLVMVCNTAHAFHEDIEAAVSIPFVSMIDEVINALKRDWPDSIRVGVMAAEGCLQAKLYQRALHNAGYQAIVWDNPQLTQFMDLIYQIKAGEMGQRVGLEMASLAEGLVQRGAEVVLIACTEIPLALNAESLSVPFIESTDVLAASVLNYSLAGAEVPVKT